MNSRIGYFFFAAIIFVFDAHAQNLSAGARRMPYFSDLMNGMPFVRPESTVEGDPYANRHWNPSAIELYGSKETYEGYYTRFNLYTNTLEVMMEKGIVGLDGDKIKQHITTDSITGVKHVYVNAREYLIDDTPLSGIVEVLADGAATLLKRPILLIQPPNYNIALNSGSRNTRITKRTELYFAFGSTTYKLKSKKKFLSAFGDQGPAMEAYIDKNALSFTEESHLKQIIIYYNQLKSGAVRP